MEYFEHQVTLIRSHREIKILGARYVCTVHEEYIQYVSNLPNIFKGVGLIESNAVLFVFLERLLGFSNSLKFSKQFWTVLELSVNQKKHVLGLNADLICDVRSQLTKPDLSVDGISPDLRVTIDSNILINKIEEGCFANSF